MSPIWTIRLLVISMFACGRTVAQVAPLPGIEPSTRKPIPIDGTPGWGTHWVNPTTLGLVDNESQQVLLINTTTGTVTRIGRKGQGPGEFQAATPPVGGANGQMLVADVMQRRLSIFDRTGKFLRSVQLQILVGPPFGWTAGGIPITWYDATARMAGRYGTITLLKGGGIELRPAVLLDSLFLHNTKVGLTGPFVPATTVDQHGTLYTGDSREYRIYQVSGTGAVTTVYTRPGIRAERLTAKEVEAQYQRLLKGAPASASQQMKDQLRAQIAALTKPLYSNNGLSVDGQGRLWVIRGGMEGGDSSQVDVFAREGKFLGTIPMAGRVRSISWNGDQAAAIVEQDAEPVYSVRFFRAR